MRHTTQALANVDYTQPDKSNQQTLNKELLLLNQQLEELYSRWEALLEKDP